MRAGWLDSTKVAVNCTTNYTINAHPRIYCYSHLVWYQTSGLLPTSLISEMRNGDVIFPCYIPKDTKIVDEINGAIQIIDLQK